MKILRSDNGGEYSGEFKAECKRSGILHQTSRAHESNAGGARKVHTIWCRFRQTDVGWGHQYGSIRHQSFTKSYARESGSWALLEESRDWLQVSVDFWNDNNGPCTERKAQEMGRQTNRNVFRWLFGNSKGLSVFRHEHRAGIRKKSRPICASMP